MCIQLMFHEWKNINQSENFYSAIYSEWFMSVYLGMNLLFRVNIYKIKQWWC